jgi:predicted kinase
MLIAAHIGPDQLLRLESRDSVSREEALEAWNNAYLELEAALTARRFGKLFVVCGPQAAGKTAWIKQRLYTASPEEVFFEGALPSRKHRERALALAKAAGCAAIAVWLQVPQHIALARNARRMGAARISEQTILHVFDQLEPPSTDEGFDEVLILDTSKDET